MVQGIGSGPNHAPKISSALIRPLPVLSLLNANLQQEFVAAIQNRLSSAGLTSFPYLNLRLYESLVMSAWRGTDMDRHTRTAQANEQCRMLMRFIQSERLGLCKGCTDPEVLNRRLPQTVHVGLLGPNETAKLFYSTIYPRARLAGDWEGRSSSTLIAGTASFCHSMPSVSIHMTPLIFTVHQMGCDTSGLTSDTTLAERVHRPSAQRSKRFKNLVSSLQILVDAGADLRVLDNAGLSAYDHARILGLDDTLIVKLRPPGKPGIPRSSTPQPSLGHPQSGLFSEAESGTVDLQGMSVSGRELLSFCFPKPRRSVSCRSPHSRKAL
jgi:hypothetical protein